MVRVLITGATGFIGSRLAAALTAEGVEVHALVRPSSDTGQIGNLPLMLHRLEEDAQALPVLLAQLQPDMIYHLAAHYVAEHRAEDISPLVVGNIVFGTQLFDACARAGTGTVLVAGTSWQHFSESDPSPASLYAATKAAQELIGTYFAAASGLRIGFLHLTDTYGPADPRRKLFSLLREAEGKGLAMSLGEQRLDLVYIDDIVAALTRAAGLVGALPAGASASWGVAAAQSFSLREVVATWERVTGRHVLVEWGGRPYRAREVMQPCRSAPPLPGWQAEISLAEGIARMEAAHVQR